MTTADAAERARALELSHHVIAVAPAGSGKTGLLVQRMLGALASVESPEQVVAITFTNKAAGEIGQRVTSLLRRAAAADVAANDHDALSLRLARAVLERDRRLAWELVSNPARLRASTIDSFNSRIAAELPLLSGLGGHLPIAQDAHALYEQALLALFDAALDPSAEPPLAQAATSWLRNADNRLDRLLDPMIALLAQRGRWIEAVIGGEWHDDETLEALHLEYHRRFAAALGSDARRLMDVVCQGARHSEHLAWAIDLHDWPRPGAAQAESYRHLAKLLVTTTGSLRKPGGVTKAIGFPRGSPVKQSLQTLLEERSDDAALAALATVVSKLPRAHYPSALHTLRGALQELLRNALAFLRLTMARDRQTDYPELALAALRALRPDGAYGDALLRRDAHIRHLLVDEMQDTSEAQVQLLRELTQGWQAGDGHSLFLVGDPQQSIYAFRDARVNLFMELWQTRCLGDLELLPVRLSVNFRSSPGLIEWFNRSFSTCFPPGDDLDTGRVAYVPAEPAQAADRPGDESASVHACATTAQEAAAVVDQVATLVASGSGSIAILARARTHLPAILAALRARDISYACQDIDALQALPAVRDILACARALWHPQDRLHWTILLRAPWVGLSWADLLALSVGRRDQPWPQRLRSTPAQRLSVEGRQRVARLLEALDDIASDPGCPPLIEQVERLWSSLGGPACGDVGDLADARRALQLLRTHAPNGFQDLRSFERAVAQLYASPAHGAVQVMTIHKAKGLEFDHVLLVGCTRKPRGDTRPLLHLVDTPHGQLLVPRPPGHWSGDEAADATLLYEYVHGVHVAMRRNETPRLLYVAATRARRHLYLFASLEPGHDGRYRAPANSFGEILWEACYAHAFQHIETPSDADSRPTPGPPRAPRLPVTFAPAGDEDIYVPRERRTLRPSEHVLSARENVAVEVATDDLYSRLIGVFYHQAVQRIAELDVATWRTESTRHQQALAAGLRRVGLPEPQVEEAVARVLELVDRTLSGKHGKWLFTRRDWTRTEYALSGYLGGEWVAAVIDRCFVDADGTLWIIDYKTAAHAIPVDERANYIASCRTRYASQLAGYAKLLRLERDYAGSLRTALYLAETDTLEACA